jgi:hypothetical protein
MRHELVPPFRVRRLFRSAICRELRQAYGQSHYASSQRLPSLAVGSELADALEVGSPASLANHLAYVEYVECWALCVCPCANSPSDHVRQVIIYP